MTNWLDDLLRRRPDVSVSSTALIASGELVDLEAREIWVWLDRDQTGDHNLQQLRYVTARVWDRLTAYANPEVLNEDGFAGAIDVLLSFLVENAEDTAEEGDPRGVLLATPPLRALGDVPLWFQRATPPDAAIGEWTAMYPEER